MEAKLYSRDLERSAYEATVANVDLYVNSVTGNDDADGSHATPFLTITRAYQEVAKRINHYVHIHLSGTFTDFPALIDNNYGSQSALSIDGTAAMVDVAAGPFTIDGGGVTNLAGCFVSDMAVVGGGLTPDAWNGKFVKFLTGAIAGAICSVLDMDATTVRIQYGFIPPSAGDTFKVVEPGVTITIPTGQYTKITGTGNCRDFGLLGVKLIADTDIEFSDLRFCFEGSIIESDATSFTGRALMDNMCWAVGTYAMPLTLFIDDNALVAGWTGACVFQQVGGGSGFVTVMNDAQINAGVLFRRPVDLTGVGAALLEGIAVEDATSYGILGYGRGGAMTLSFVYVKAKTTEYAVTVVDVAMLSVWALYVAQGLAAINLSPGSNAHLIGLEGDNAAVTNALLVGQGSRVAVDASGMTLVGAGGAGTAVTWGSGEAAVGWPIANALAADTKGAQVAGY